MFNIQGSLLRDKPQQADRKNTGAIEYPAFQEENNNLTKITGLFQPASSS